MRVYELAKELKMSSKELLAYLKDLSIEVKSHASSITDDQAEQVRGFLSEESGDDVAPAPTESSGERGVESMPDTSGDDAGMVESKAEDPSPVQIAEQEPEEEVEVEQSGPSTIVVKGPIVVKSFAEELGLKPNQLIAELMSMNIFASINEKLDFNVAGRIAEKHGMTLEKEKKAPEPAPQQQEVEMPAKRDAGKPEDLLPRPPVVTFLGHVDHGKTSLLDHIRHSHVVDGESGGITQHVGAYTVEYNDHVITFIDTPGHAAFTNMRARGANLTDIAIIVIAADDGIMTQTREALQHARAAGVTIMVAINKTDLPSARVDRVKQQLQQEGLSPEDWGGDIICCPVSAQTGEGIDNMLEMIILQAEIMELKANPKSPARGFVIEARLEQGMGPTANILVKEGTLKVGDAIVCGQYWGRVKALINDRGIKVRTAGPSIPVKCLGLNNVPDAGAEFEVCDNDRTARRIADERSERRRVSQLGDTQRTTSLDDLLRDTEATEKVELKLVAKADVQGTLEAIQHSLSEISSEKVTLTVILSGVGNITENDVILASASDAIIVGFHVAKEPGVSGLAKREGVEIRLYSIIYELVDDIRNAMTGLLQPISRKVVIGQAEVRQIFDISKKGRVAGCMTIKGRITSKARTRVKRGDEVLYEGSASSLKRFQNDASEVREGQECGIRLENFSNFEVGDIIEFYELEHVAQQL